MYKMLQKQQGGNVRVIHWSNLSVESSYFIQFSSVQFSRSVVSDSR